jgi:hypothetical protein
MITVSILPAQICHPEVINIPYLIDPYIRKGIIKAFITILNQEVENRQFWAFLVQDFGGIKIPRIYNEAISDKGYGEEWKAVNNEEIISLVANGTWEQFILPKGANLVSTKWVFIIKTKSDGCIEQFNERHSTRIQSSLWTGFYRDVYTNCMYGYI